MRLLLKQLFKAAGLFCIVIVLIWSFVLRVSAEDLFLYDSRGKRDPFEALVRDGRFVGVSQQDPEHMFLPILYGIVWDAQGESIALLNDEEVAVGDMIREFKVEEISKDAVVITRGAERFELTLEFE